MATESSDNAATPRGLASEKSQFTDFVVECEGYSFRVLKFHLFMQSGYFRAMLSSQMQEATYGKVKFTDIDPCLMARFLLFCYDNSTIPEVLLAESLPADCQAIVARDKYARTTTHSFLRAELNLDLIVLAERFDVRLLNDKATEGFKRAYSSLDASGTAPRALLDRDRCLSLIERVYTKIDGTACQVYVLESLKKQIEGKTYAQKRYSDLKEIINTVPALREKIIEEYMNMVVVPCARCGCDRSKDGAYSIHLEALGDTHGNRTVRIQETTTVQDVLEKYREAIRSGNRRFSSVPNGNNLYLEYDGQRLGNSTLMDCLGLEVNAKVQVGIEE